MSDVFCTLMAEVTAIVNQRPLLSVSNDPENPSVLSPSTILTQKFNNNSELGKTGVGWDKFWLGQCPSVPNEWPDGDTNDVFRKHVITAWCLGAMRVP